MALVKCYECSKEISDKAPTCPHCGAPKEEQPPRIEKADILESVAVVDEPEPITQETVSAPVSVGRSAIQRENEWRP
jgi:predicted amidophosphoribosyltransferase